MVTCFVVTFLSDQPCGYADEQEQELVPSQLPAIVRDAAVAAVDGIELEEAEAEAVLIYELKGTAGGTEYEIELTCEGDILEIDVEGDDGDDGCDDDQDGNGENELAIPVSAVPERVRAAAEAAVEGIEFSEAEVESVLVYEVEGVANGKEYEIEITAEGQVIEVEEEEGE